jgi:hypothetical protein
MEYIALLTLGIFPILLAILGLILAVIWIILPFYLLALCHRVARLEAYIAALYTEMPRDKSEGEQ